MIYKNSLFVIIVLFVILLSSCSSKEDDKLPQRPNILFIMADDLGFSDLSCYGGEIQTPNIDKLAEGGARFNRFYVSPMCVTSRVALMSGMEYKAAGEQNFPNGLSFAKLLRDAGYKTSLVGKNHGMPKLLIGNPETDFGFDHFYGFTGGELNSFTGEGNVKWQYDGKIFPNTDLPDDFYTTKDFTDYAIKFIGEAINEDKPFFTFLAYNAPHSPLNAPERNVRKYYDPENGVNIYKDGWEKLRVKRLERMKRLGIVDEFVKLSEPGVEIPDWELLPETSEYEWELQKEFEYLSRSAFAGMVDNIDENIGRLIAYLNDPNGDGENEDSKINNTIIIFVSDNGGCYAGMPTNRDALPWNKDNGWFTTNYGWGTLSNTPFRYYKHASHEGAIRSPLVVHWPDGLTLPKNSINKQMLRIWDLYPTFIELAGTNYPTEKRELKPLMGKSFLPLLNGKEFNSEEYFVSAFDRSRGIIKDGWKLVGYYDSPYELYNLKTDPSETINIAKEHPEIFNELLQMWENYVVTHGFENDENYNRKAGIKKRNWGYDFKSSGLVASSPEYMSENAATNDKLMLQFEDIIDFSDTKGKFIRLQKYGDSKIIWSADPDKNHPYQGKNKIVFEDFPRLEPNTHYYITWDHGFVKYKSEKGFLPIAPVKESAWSFRFRTGK